MNNNQNTFCRKHTSITNVLLKSGPTALEGKKKNRIGKDLLAKKKQNKTLTDSCRNGHYQHLRKSRSHLSAHLTHFPRARSAIIHTGMQT